MKKQWFSIIAAGLFVVALNLTGCMQKNTSGTGQAEAVEAPGKVKRVGMVVKLNPQYIDEYRALHADSNPGVRDLLVKANMRNFSIFLHQFDDGNWYEFGYYEYTGSDFEADMAALAKEDRNIEWLKVCDPMQIPFEGYKGWAEMEQVYYNK